MPYTPTVQDRTGEFLMRGITGAADSLAEGIRTWKKNKEESKGFDTLIEGAVKADPTLAEKYGDQLAKAPGMSLSQKKSLAGTLALETQNKRLAREEQMKQEDLNLRKAYFDLQQGQMNRANARDAAGQRFTQSLAKLMGTGGGPSMDFANTLADEPLPARDVGLADIVQSAGESGLALEPTSLAQLLRAEQMGQRWNAGAALAFQEDPVTGARLATFGNSVIPTGTNPAKQQAQAVDITDGEGNVIGQGIPGRNGLQLIRQPAKGLTANDRIRALNEQLKQTYDPAKREQLLKRLDALINGEQPAAPPAGAASPEALLNEARDAISRGAPKEAVLKRLKELGIANPKL